jgi:hypothetical protein
MPAATPIRIDNNETVASIHVVRDERGRQLDAHDGNILGPIDGRYFLYAANYGLNCNPPTNELGNAVCDHSVSVYSSTDLAQWRWIRYIFRPVQLLTNTTVAYRPKVVYNPRTATYVLWINWLMDTGIGSNASGTEKYSESVYAVLTSTAPDGNFTVVNRNVATRFPMVGDFAVLVDDQHDAYLLYTACITCYVNSSLMTPRWLANCQRACRRDSDRGKLDDYDRNRGHGRERVGNPDFFDHVLSVEKLVPDFTSSLGPTAGSAPSSHATKYSSGFMPNSSCEAPAFFQRGGWVYALYAGGCGFCPQGSGVVVHTAKHPLGPYTIQGEIANGPGPEPICRSTVCSQQNFVAEISSLAANGTITPQWIWIGDRWKHSTDPAKNPIGYSGQYWAPLTFTDAGVGPPTIAHMPYTPSFEINVSTTPLDGS